MIVFIAIMITIMTVPGLQLFAAHQFYNSRGGFLFW
jgi:hypothetical protein